MALSVALVGCGGWGRIVLRDLVSLGCDLTVVGRSEATRERALAGGAARAVAGIEELQSVAGVVVVVPTPAHEEVVQKALVLDVPVFVEKPLTDDVAAARRLAAAGERLFVMDKWRYHPGVGMLGEIARSGELGGVVGLKTVRVGWGNPHSGSDAVWILAPHDLAIALEILGEVPAPRAAVAERIGSTMTGLSGLLGNTPWFTLDVSAAHTERRREVRLVCEGGVAVLASAYADHIAILRGDPQCEPRGLEPELRPIGTEMPLLRELEAFLGHLDGGPPPRSSAEEGAAMVVALADLVALATGAEHDPGGRR
jgi:predicted dehydrogenase